MLISGGSAPVSEFVQAAPADLRPQVEETMSSIDPLRYIAQARPGSLLLQDGRRDCVIPRKALQALIDAAPDGTEVRWYDAEHALGPVAYREHMRWLADQLDIDGPPVPGREDRPVAGVASPVSGTDGGIASLDQNERDWPPSTVTQVPTTQDARSETRNATTSAISSTVPNRPQGSSRSTNVGHALRIVAQAALPAAAGEQRRSRRDAEHANALAGQARRPSPSRG